MKTTTFRLVTLAVTILLSLSGSLVAQHSDGSIAVRDADNPGRNLEWNSRISPSEDDLNDPSRLSNHDSITYGKSILLEMKTRYAVFPNPSSGKSKLTVQLKPKDSQLLLYDLTGRVLIKTTVDPDQDYAEINIIKLYKGIYFLKVLAGESLAGIEKVVIN